MPFIACLAACAASLPDLPAQDTARPAAMFVGTHCGDAVLTKPGGEVASRMTVTSFGEIDGGILVLDQIIDAEGEPPRERRWTIRPDGPDSYVGTLTGDDGVAASGTVRAEVAGNQLRLSYPVDSLPFAKMTQILTRQADGSIANEGTVRLLGVTLRRLEETIEVRDGVDRADGFRCSTRRLDENTEGTI